MIMISDGPCEHVDADSSVKDALSLCYVLVTRADQDIGAVPSKEAEGKRSDSLYAAKIENRVCAAEIEGVEHGGINANTGPWRTCRDHMLDTCYLGGRHRHDGRGEVGVTPTRHVGAGCSYRNVAMSCD